MMAVQDERAWALFYVTASPVAAARPIFDRWSINPMYLNEAHALSSCLTDMFAANPSAWVVLRNKGGSKFKPDAVLVTDVLSKKVRGRIIPYPFSPNLVISGHQFSPHDIEAIDPLNWNPKDDYNMMRGNGTAFYRTVVAPFPTKGMWTKDQTPRYDAWPIPVQGNDISTGYLPVAIPPPLVSIRDLLDVHLGGWVSLTCVMMILKCSQDVVVQMCSDNNFHLVQIPVCAVCGIGTQAGIDHAHPEQIDGKVRNIVVIPDVTPSVALSSALARLDFTATIPENTIVEMYSGYRVARGGRVTSIEYHIVWPCKTRVGMLQNLMDGTTFVSFIWIPPAGVCSRATTKNPIEHANNVHRHTQRLQWIIAASDGTPVPPVWATLERGIKTDEAYWETRMNTDPAKFKQEVIASLRNNSHMKEIISVVRKADSVWRARNT